MPESVDVEVAPGHRITGEQLVSETGRFGVEKPVRVDISWRYSCSCGEIAEVDTDTAQAHVEDVTP